MAKSGRTLSPDNTRFIEFGRQAQELQKLQSEGKPENFDFLRFTDYCGKARQGWLPILRASVKPMPATLKAVRMALRKRIHDYVAVAGRLGGQVVRSCFNYFTVPGQLHRLRSFFARKSVEGGVKH